MSDEKMMIKKHSAMVQTNVKELTLTQRKLINYLIFIVQKTAKSEIYKTTISSIKDVCNIGKTENVDLKEQLKKLANIKIEFNYMNKDKNEVWEYMSLLSLVKIVPNESEVSFELPSVLRDRLINPRLYTPINVILIAGLKSSYSIVMYEFLRDYLTAPGIPLLTIEQFRILMGVRENEYKFFPNLKNRVIDPAIREINEKTDIRCEYQLVKEHRNCYSHIQFTVTKQDFQLMFEIKEEERKPTETKSQLPQNIINTIPEQHRTAAIKELLMKFLDKGNDYIISNIKYAIKHAKENFGAYLKQALENDYAGHEREVEAKAEEKKAKKKRQADQEEEAKRIAHNDYIETLKKIERLESAETKALQAKFQEIVKISGIKKDFLTGPVKESLMVEAYQALYRVDGYNAKDQD